ncbi:hypothetical protein OF829_10090 [Sphingomonas sp. LB-2]|uniref:hypothetical protein n=1 Tax=Sphingomonas caeni TaxID=2984949 RepID=UPI0022328A33|nr:hypothetical protein [Sphingomonas caeni]MCW3847593.1 hypothetical protein [Sphingomonas caeni]
MTELAPAELALRVGIFAGVLGLVGWLPADLQWMAAAVLLIVALIFLYEIWAARASRRKQRDALVVALMALGGAGALVEGWTRYIATPLLALGGICIALWFVGTLSASGEDSESETEH